MRQSHRVAEMSGGEPCLLRLGQQLPVFGPQLGEPAPEVFDTLGQSFRRALFRLVRVAQGGEGGHSGGVQCLYRAAAFRQFAQAAVGVTGVQSGKLCPGGLFLLAESFQPGFRLLLPPLQVARSLRCVPGRSAPLGEDVQLLLTFRADVRRTPVR